MIFRHRHSELIYLTGPQTGAGAVGPFPDQWKAADAIKEAGHHGGALIASAQPFQHPSPGRYGYGVAQGRVTGAGGAFLVPLALAVYPGADVRPFIRKKVISP